MRWGGWAGTWEDGCGGPEQLPSRCKLAMEEGVVCTLNIAIHYLRRQCYSCMIRQVVAIF